MLAWAATMGLIGTNCVQGEAPPSAPGWSSASFNGAPPPADLLSLGPVNEPWAPAVRLASEIGDGWNAWTVPPDGARVLVASDGVEALAFVQALRALAPKATYALGEGSPRLAFDGAWLQADIDAKGELDWNRSRKNPAASWAADLRADGFTHAWLLAPAQIDKNAWAGRAAVAFGGCAPVRAVWGEAQARGLAATEAFFDDADVQLAEAFGRALLEADIDARVDGGPRCAASIESFEASLQACISAGGFCAWAPRMFAMDRVRIGAPDLMLASGPSDAGAPGTNASACVAEPAKRVEAARRRAALEVGPRLQRGWSELADRVASLGFVDGVVHDACAPRRRRFDAAALARFDATVGEIRQAYTGLVRPVDDAAWRSAAGHFHVPGLGAHAQYMWFDAGPAAGGASMRRTAEELRDDMLASGRCAAPQGEGPLVAVLIDLRTPAIVEIEAVYPETLTCESLGPLGL